MLRKCKDCGKEATIEEELILFRVDYTMKYNRANLCKKCDNRRKENGRSKSNQRDWYYKKQYSISLEDYNTMFLKQKGCCKICNKHQSVLNKRLHVDHCHLSGNVRGLLCNACNKALGIFNDDVTSLENAIKYLKDNYDSNRCY